MGGILFVNIDSDLVFHTHTNVLMWYHCPIMILFYIIWGPEYIFLPTFQWRIRLLGENSVLLEVNDLHADKGCGVPWY